MYIPTYVLLLYKHNMKQALQPIPLDQAISSYKSAIAPKTLIARPGRAGPARAGLTKMPPN
jgi:hypothetical protein